MNPKLLREAWKLYESESRTGTYIAVILVLIVVSPLLLRVWKRK